MVLKTGHFLLRTGLTGMQTDEDQVYHPDRGLAISYYQPKERKVQSSYDVPIVFRQRGEDLHNSEDIGTHSWLARQRTMSFDRQENKQGSVLDTISPKTHIDQARRALENDPNNSSDQRRSRADSFSTIYCDDSRQDKREAHRRRALSETDTETVRWSVATFTTLSNYTNHEGVEASPPPPMPDIMPLNIKTKTSKKERPSLTRINTGVGYKSDKVAIMGAADQPPPTQAIFSPFSMKSPAEVAGADTVPRASPYQAFRPFPQSAPYESKTSLNYSQSALVAEITAAARGAAGGIPYETNVHRGREVARPVKRADPYMNPEWATSLGASAAPGLMAPYETSIARSRSADGPQQARRPIVGAGAAISHVKRPAPYETNVGLPRDGLAPESVWKPAVVGNLTGSTISGPAPYETDIARTRLGYSTDVIDPYNSRAMPDNGDGSDQNGLLGLGIIDQNTNKTFQKLGVSPLAPFGAGPRPRPDNAHGWNAFGEPLQRAAPSNLSHHSNSQSSDNGTNSSTLGATADHNQHQILARRSLQTVLLSEYKYVSDSDSSCNEKGLITGQQETRKQPFWKRRKVLLISGGILLLLIVIIAIAVGVVVSKNKNSNSAPKTSPSSTSTPAPKPTASTSTASGAATPTSSSVSSTTSVLGGFVTQPPNLVGGPFAMVGTGIAGLSLAPVAQANGKRRRRDDSGDALQYFTFFQHSTGELRMSAFNNSVWQDSVSVTQDAASGTPLAIYQNLKTSAISLFYFDQSQILQEMRSDPVNINWKKSSLGDLNQTSNAPSDLTAEFVGDCQGTELSWLVFHTGQNSQAKLLYWEQQGDKWMEGGTFDDVKQGTGFTGQNAGGVWRFFYVSDSTSQLEETICPDCCTNPNSKGWIDGLNGPQVNSTSGGVAETNTALSRMIYYQDLDGTIRELNSTGKFPDASFVTNITTNDGVNSGSLVPANSSVAPAGSVVAKAQPNTKIGATTVTANGTTELWIFYQSNQTNLMTQSRPVNGAGQWSPAIMVPVGN